MAAKHKVTVSMQSTNHRPNSAERRAAHLASVAGRQAELKQEAAERRAARANRQAPTALEPNRATGADRSISG